MQQIGNTEILASTPDHPVNARRRWLAMLTGLNLAIAVSYLGCKPPQNHTLSLGARLLTSAAYILIACLAGSFGTWIALPRNARHQFRSLALWGIRCWVFLPSIMIFLREKVLWAPILAFSSAVLMALYLSRMTNAPPRRSDQEVEKNIFITQLHFEPISSATVAASLCLYGAVVSAMTGRTSLSTLLLATGSFLLTSRIIATQSRTGDRPRQRPRPYALIACAFLCAFVALTVPGQIRYPLFEQPSAVKSQAARQASQQTSSAGYRTIVLWPLPKKEKMLTSPSTDTDASSGHKARPWVIPFDGPYWYFKFPGESPGPLARNAHGDPLKVNVRSTDTSPLLMEAHQYLAAPVDLSCCRELQVVFRNDVSLGASQVGILLTDSHAKSKSSQSLGIKPIAPGPPGQTPQNSSPIEETVSFPIPKPSTIKQFDQITVALLPRSPYATAGRKVAIEEFIMIPN
ncbi:MAG TPA: hypothetical protein VMU57_00625 [Edaphobacter sp.]|uniref:hypothetical protein n=1 Tax=Edaphobacter sp. TaxID=1934404 RepID=UPI002C647594|nr:hypothetical protein [Edaphobacter sp.]HUZ93395.1 hypothetical protein [Edaphobacter sp.]